jgi:hypothetical protein
MMHDNISKRNDEHKSILLLLLKKVRYLQIVLYLRPRALQVFVLYYAMQRVPLAFTIPLQLVNHVLQILLAVVDQRISHQLILQLQKLVVFLHKTAGSIAQGHLRLGKTES